MSVASTSMADMDITGHNEWVDGMRVAPRIVTHDETIAGRYRGGIVVRPGATLHLTGQHQGSLTLDPGSSAVTTGRNHGSVHVGDGASLVVESQQQGSLHVATGGTARIEPAGQCQGSAHFDGLLINEGSRGGSEHGSGAIRDLAGSRVVQPIFRDGGTVYEW